MLDAAGAARLGVNEIRCTFLRAGPQGIIGSRLICDNVYTLRDGTITASGSFSFTKKPIATFALNGGTGAYEGARGSGRLTYRSLNNPLAATTIHLLP